MDNLGLIDSITLYHTDNSPEGVKSQTPVLHFNKYNRVLTRYQGISPIEYIEVTEDGRKQVRLSQLNLSNNSIVLVRITEKCLGGKLLKKGS